MAKQTIKSAKAARNRLQALYEGCYAFSAVLDVARAAHGALHIDRPINMRDTRVVGRKRGDHHLFGFEHYLKAAFEADTIANPVQQSWFAMAILTAGAELSPFNYFNRAPRLEVIYHLRNAIAHGGRFHFTEDCRQRLSDYPANTFGTEGMVQFEVTAALDGQEPLFELLHPGDVIDVLIGATFYLSSIVDDDAPFLDYPRGSHKLRKEARAIASGTTKR